MKEIDVEVDNKEISVKVDEDCSLEQVADILEIDLESIIFSKNGEFVSAKEKIGKCQKIKIHRVVSGG